MSDSLCLVYADPAEALAMTAYLNHLDKCEDGCRPDEMRATTALGAPASRLDAVGPGRRPCPIGKRLAAEWTRAVDLRRSAAEAG
jgi:hypothetical protein